MSAEKKIEEDGEYRTPTCSEWLKKVDRDLEELHKSPYELEEKRKLMNEDALLAKAIQHLREAVMSLAMRVASVEAILLDIQEKKEVAPTGKKSMGRKN